MTSGERMVWAAEFVREFNAGQDRDDETRCMEAASSAAGAVYALRSAARDARDADVVAVDVKLMLDDMLSNGGDR